MRLLLTPLVLIASTAAAQAPPADSLAAAHLDALYFAGAVGAASLGVVGYTVGNAVDDNREPGGTVALIAMPVGAVLGVLVGAHHHGIPGSVKGAAGGAIRGAFYSYAASLGILLVAIPAGASGLGLALLASGVALTALPVVHTARGYVASPARVRAPDGTTAPGIALRLAF